MRLSGEGHNPVKAYFFNPGHSELPGDDSEGPDGTGGLEFECRQEAVWSLAAAPGL